ncbi:MAG: nuclear transport factor 2 family protein [Acidobacteriota bacterium]
MSADTHPHEVLIRRFYDAFAARDHATMATFYHPDATFSDPAFPQLEGRDAVAGMWRMLCIRGTDLALTYDNVHADDSRGGARWTARYTFRMTGRPVVNVIDAEMTFADGLIRTHVDHFDFHKWSRQALGLPGLMLGWSGSLRRKVQKTAGGQLAKFRASEAAD